MRVRFNLFFKSFKELFLLFAFEPFGESIYKIHNLMGVIEYFWGINP